MSEQTSGTRVTFAEVQRKAWRSTGTVPCVRALRYPRNITYTTGNEGSDLPRSGTAVLAVPSPTIPAPRPDIMAPTESGESFAHGITDPHATVAVSLHAFGLGAREQGVRNVPIVAEHRKVVPSHALDCTEGAQA